MPWDDTMPSRTSWIRPSGVLRGPLPILFIQRPSSALYNLGLIYEKKGDPETALKQYQEAVRLQRNYGSGLLPHGAAVGAVSPGG